MRLSATLLALFIVAGYALAAPDWLSTVSPETKGPIPDIAPFSADFRFGWSGIEAARAHVDLWKEPSAVCISARGWSTGIARLLWKADIFHYATSTPGSFEMIAAHQWEFYRKKTIETWMLHRDGTFWRLHRTEPPGEWKRVDLTPIRDLFSAMLLIRSQRFAPGNTYRTIVYPGDSPYLVDVAAAGRETISVAGRQRSAIKLRVNIQRINLKKSGLLEPHKKFRTATVWLSDDEHRFPLRAEADIFIGSVFAELVPPQR